MGCGSSAQPAEDTQQQQTLTEGSKDTATADQVEPFNNTSKTPSPKSKTKQKETIVDGPVPEPSAYVPVVESDDNIDALSSIGTPFGGSPHSSQDMQEDNIRAPGLSPAPGYKMENETRKIGGFDPEAFRKANAINNGGANQSGTAADSWAQPVPSNNSFQQPQRTAQVGTAPEETVVASKHKMVEISVVVVVDMVMAMRVVIVGDRVVRGTTFNQMTFSRPNRLRRCKTALV